MSPPSDSAQKRQLRSATKCFLFSINLITFIFGLVLFFLGLVLQTRHGQVKNHAISIDPPLFLATLKFQYFFSDSDDDGKEGGEQGSTPPSTSSTSSAFYDLSAWCTAMGVIVCIVSFLGETVEKSYPEKSLQKTKDIENCNAFVQPAVSAGHYRRRLIKKCCRAELPFLSSSCLILTFFPTVTFGMGRRRRLQIAVILPSCPSLFRSLRPDELHNGAP